MKTRDRNYCQHLLVELHCFPGLHYRITPTLISRYNTECCQFSAFSILVPSSHPSPPHFLPSYLPTTNHSAPSIQRSYNQLLIPPTYSTFLLPPTM
jgi:hypothetical protein